jgi:hypothetical protein
MNADQATQPAAAPVTAPRRRSWRLFAVTIGLACLVSAMPISSADPFRPTNGIEAMAARLQAIAKEVKPQQAPFVVNDLRADALARELEKDLSVEQRLRLRFFHARELINSGSVREGLEALEGFEEDARKNLPEMFQQTTLDVGVLRAIAWLRIAEEENCHQANNKDSCLLPIQGEGVHTQREGASRAAEVLTALLRSHPDDLNARWLLNLAHMTLGSYPDGVPIGQQIPPTVFASHYPLPRFDNVAREAGVDVYGLSGGAVLEDLDNDDHLDLMVSHIGFTEQTRFFHGNGDGTFVERTVEAGITGEVGGLNMNHADYDNDGFPDVLILRGGWMASEGKFPLSLLRNNGKGGFEDVTESVGLLRFAPTQTAVWLDYDGDGWLDLYVGNESVPAGITPATNNPAELFHSNGDGTFTNVAPDLGVDFAGFIKGVASSDYNHDGRPDLYVSVLNGDNLLFRNDGPAPAAPGGWKFTNVAEEAGVLEPKHSFGTFFFDYDNDGWDDLFVVGYGVINAGDSAADYLGLPTPAERGRLFRNNGNGTFADVTKQTGLFKVVPGMGHNFGDLDNDGFLDFYLATGTPELGYLVPNRMFRNAGGRYFQDVTLAGNFGHIQKGHAVVFGDIDGDGDEDIFNQMGGAFKADKAYSALYRNPGTTNRWLRLELEGNRTNRSAIGARIRVTVDGPSGPRQIFRTVTTGGSFGSSPLRQHIGVGDAASVTSVEIFWPVTGQQQSLGPLKLDRLYRVREGAATVDEG